MSTAVITPSLPGPQVPASIRWIISRTDDLLWFIGSAAVSYAALALMAVGFPVTLIYFIWFVGIDGPHVIATVTRTYCDKQERARLGWLLWMIVPLVAIGPVMVALRQAALFYLFAVCWQHYHIAKQHFGFIMLWKAKNRERDPAGHKLDRVFLLSSTILPLMLFVARTRLPHGNGLQLLTTITVLTYLVLLVHYVAQHFRFVRSGAIPNTPKFLLLAVLVPLQWLAFAYAERFGPDGILRAGILLGLFHSFQYHRLLWFHNRNRYSSPNARAHHGTAAILAKHFGYYMGAAVGLHLVTTILPQVAFPATEWLKAAIWGVPFTHYVLDSKIWHVRGNKDLAAALKL